MTGAQIYHFRWVKKEEGCFNLYNTTNIIALILQNLLLGGPSMVLLPNRLVSSSPYGRSSSTHTHTHTNMKLSLPIHQLCSTFTFSLILPLFLCSSSSSIPTTIPTPAPWPEQFHALLYMNLSSARLQMSDLWYDWPRGRNVNIFQKQLGEVLYDIEWDNGTSYYYTLGANGSCRVMEFEVGIPRPDFLDGAEYLGTQVTDGFLCNVWQKVDFIWYYEDVLTRLPVRWDFYDGTLFLFLFFLINNICF